jgi:hypothetical protein
MTPAFVSNEVDSIHEPSAANAVSDQDDPVSVSNEVEPVREPAATAVSEDHTLPPSTLQCSQPGSSTAENAGPGVDCK